MFICEVKEFMKKVKCVIGEVEEVEFVVDELVVFVLLVGLVGMGLVGLDLEIFFKGNGRSVREWVDGINVLK